MYIYRYILSGIAVSLFLFSGWSTHGYFEYKFRCVLGGNTVSISLQEGQLCFDYLAQTNVSIKEVQKDIENAEYLISQQQDTHFWQGILVGLRSQEQELIQKQTVVLGAMKDFEAALFDQVKQLLNKPITTEKKLRLSRIDTMKQNMESTKKQGLTDTYELIVIKMERLQYELFVMDRMLYATDFEEMVPFLKEYLSWSRS